MRGVLCALACVFLTATAHADLLDREWKAAPATGVELTIGRDRGRTGNDALRLDFDFHGHGGYAIARREGAIELPENFELSFWMRAEAPRNTLEVKFARGDDVWWSVRRELDFPREWRRFSVKKRNVEFAWGPGRPGPLPRTVDALEIVVTAGTGGKGTVWIDDVEIMPLDTAPEGPLPKVTNVPWTGRRPVHDRSRPASRVRRDGHRLGDPPDRYDIATSFDGKEWTVVRKVKATNGGRDWISLPDGDARWIRIEMVGGAIRDVRLLPPMRSDNEFFAAMAEESPRGDYPAIPRRRAILLDCPGRRERRGCRGAVQRGRTIEAGNARFSIEPFLVIDGKLVTWNNAGIEQRPGPRWSGEGPHDHSACREQRPRRPIRDARERDVLLAIRPFQVNPPGNSSSAPAGR